ncbi:hydroxymethylbilane synthase [Sulfolobus acidocaldarius]|uniref:Hydroxymethylbilane synthase n=4 Tax=Sulfolobus acidocaldarius TaxID=2285 RepID=Q4JAM6_SULAC|nr:hydroxymethylbilane synthase [Sulfolobus acidocaldarius]AAY80153.1 porphobilinogen deaminase [Sulfolobus acidocaldarius DSM 639]AGE70729.1 porphobilinogen deaminase [Sulfolobus acidocaldarius N8]AGE73001.1 porphobilinogen deaminase [Sulfolobus acidocaldarius Ron12/I]ALU28937.1 porphobilinogen deaminase [Sulfolobus acidocaldarius]ALU31663.1 porphobilinogen deaminase [Sulfolobus acidocaldarius]
MRIRIAARGSLLSRIQVKMVEDKLRNLGIETELIVVKTKADLFQDKPLNSLGKGVFEKEVNEAVINGEADIAVHSMKDMLSDMDEKLVLYGVLPRDSPYDSLVAEKDLFNIESGKVIGTSSIRRRSMISFYRRDLVVKDLRGNIDTRLKKYQSKEYDGIVIAEAAIKRLNSVVRYYKIDPKIITPEANQGIIAIVGRVNEKLKTLFRELNDERTLKEALVERTVVKLLGGGCHSPIGILASMISENEFNVISTYVISDKKKITIEGIYRGDPTTVGEKVVKDMVKVLKHENSSVTT